MKISYYFKTCFSLMLTVICSMLGGGAVMMAATDLPTTETDPNPGKSLDAHDGISTTSEITGQTKQSDGTYADNADPDFLDKEIDRKITKIRPMSTPIDQISRYADAGTTKQFEFKYFSIGTRPIKTTLATEFKASTDWASGADSATLKVANPSMFTKDDTIRVVGVKATHNTKGETYSSSSKIYPDLVLKVCGFASTGGYPIVYAVNGDIDSNTNLPIVLPDITAGTTLIRMGKACGEVDAQTGRFANIPAAETQYCQNFMMQVEMSTFDRISAKSVDWTFSDIEEDGIYDMRLGMEGSFLFGDLGVIRHSSKENMATWFTRGIWWMAGKEITIGTYANSVTTISDDDLVDLARDLFVGTGCGNKRKIMFCGSDMLTALSKIKSDKFRLKDTVEIWNLKFKSWDTDFGEILTIHHEFFDMNGMSDQALAIDPDFLSKKKFISWTRNVLDLKTAGIRNTDAVVLQEASALYLRYPQAHARIKLNKTA